MKKRHRKDLSAEEIEEIVAATKEPFRLHKDVAEQFRIPAQLVSGLAREAEKKPEKLQQKRNREHIEEQKRAAIEESVSLMLKANKPIVRAQ